MKGEWKTRCGLFAVVDRVEGDRLYGDILLPPGSIEGWLSAVPTFWAKNGDSENTALDLIERRRGKEQWK
jgi:hypothetical protein